MKEGIMKMCPHCGQENSDSSQVCIECSRPLKKKRRANRVLSGIGWIVAGVILIAAELLYDLDLFGLTGPWVMAALGMVAVVKGLVDVFGGIAGMLGRKEKTESMGNSSEQLRAPRSHGQWKEWWNARTEAMEAVLGKMDGEVLHATIPFQLGIDMGGAADVVSFSQNLDGIAYVTSELIGMDGQAPGELGNYELMICHRTPSDLGPRIIRLLAHHTLDTPLNPGDTMDIGEVMPEGSTIAALLFLEYARFKVLGRDAGLLLCVGITQDELDVKVEQGSSVVVQRLKAHDVYPYTDLNRQSVFS
jgi:hypothetical protein